ncbi:Vesicle-associated membrane protein-associated protein [Lachnellula hyalina]|uniref:Vesicle-associated membrane protein-associated protein n=1 Tax=Lachnellula hyalina TaxID=1316788 RepID=A0A8H8QSS6_9HELO|nr:Vesicle-associated membrane protein-associated protein [Lachnellula hyalina]TVY22118.1 Vesicle-associated membrane protein-associated protein [Lachnellula hyalina]
MSVEIDPQELGFVRGEEGVPNLFTGPFTTEVSQNLKIRNPNSTPVAFKVKTTAPKQYCVRPNSGRIEPGKEVEVSVLLQAMKQEPPLDAKCRDKFLVQSVAVTADKEFTNTGSIHVDDADKASVQEKKIRVVYLQPHGLAATSTPLRQSISGPNGADTPDTAPPAYSNQRSPSPEQTFTPETTSRRSLAPSIKLEESPAPAATYDEIKAKLAEAQATIASYTQEGGVRLRKVANGETSNETVNELAHKMQASASQGVPLQIVAALCLLSFLLAYVFF